MIDMNDVEGGVRCWKGLQWSFDLSVDFRLLTGMTSSGRGGNVAFHVWPDIQFRDQATRGLNTLV